MNESIAEYMEIPAIFYSHATNKPFEECLTCKKSLLTDGTSYVIEKAIKRYPGFKATDVITEYAICLTCNEKMRDTMSAHSKKVIENYFNQRVNLQSRREQLLQEKGTDLNAWLNNCLIYNTQQDKLFEFQIYAQCDGKYLLFTYMPFMISGKAIEEIADLLSVETQEVLDKFIDEHFGLPPEFNNILKDRKIILL